MTKYATGGKYNVKGQVILDKAPRGFKRILNNKYHRSRSYTTTYGGPQIKYPKRMR